MPITFISVGDQTQDGDLDGFLDTINYLLNQDAPPQVLTTSYGDYEPDIPIAMAEYVEASSRFELTSEACLTWTGTCATRTRNLVHVGYLCYLPQGMAVSRESSPSRAQPLSPSFPLDAPSEFPVGRVSL